MGIFADVRAARLGSPSSSKISAAPCSLQPSGKFLVGFYRRFEHDERLGLDQLVLVLPSDDSRLQYVRMSAVRTFYFDRRHV